MKLRMPQHRPGRGFFFRRLILVGILVALFAPAGIKNLAVFNPLDPTGRVTATREATNPRLTNARRIHILYGDKTGGGHLSGLGKPCKSEFPADWSEKDITDTITAIAANDNLGWEQQRNGNIVADTVDHGVKIRVVLNRDRSEIVTAYPLSTPRNPCPAANDNNKD